jgi:hypothetical protein
MKKTIFIILLAFLSLHSFSQTKKNSIGVNKQYNTPDTTRSFVLMNILNFDNSKDSLIKFWGKPKNNETGQISWTHIDIPNVGKDLNVILTDRICTIEKGYMMCIQFKDKEDKEMKMKNLKSNQLRDIEITITNQVGKNIINSKTKTEIVKTLLESIVE